MMRRFVPLTDAVRAANPFCRLAAPEGRHDDIPSRDSYSAEKFQCHQLAEH